MVEKIRENRKNQLENRYTCKYANFVSSKLCLLRYFVSTSNFDRKESMFVATQRRRSIDGSFIQPPEIIKRCYSPGLVACDDPASVAASQVPLFSRSATLSRPQPRGRCYRQVRLCTRVISSWWIQARPHPRCNFLPEARSRSENESRILFEFITEERVCGGKKRGAGTNFPLDITFPNQFSLYFYCH